MLEVQIVDVYNKFGSRVLIENKIIIEFIEVLQIVYRHTLFKTPATILDIGDQMLQ